MFHFLLRKWTVPLLHPPVGDQPFPEQFRPRGDVRVFRGEPESVAAVGEDMHFKRHAEFAQPLGVAERIQYRDQFVVCRVPEEGTRRLFVRDPVEREFGGKFALPFSKQVGGGLLAGKSFCFTGELVTMKRADAEQLVKKNGGSIKSSVTKDLSYLVTNDTTSGSSKNQKAAKLGIPVIDEKTFLELI